MLSICHYESVTDQECLFVVVLILELNILIKEGVYNFYALVLFTEMYTRCCLGVLESVYIKTQNPVLYRQKEFVFSLKLSN